MLLQVTDVTFIDRGRRVLVATQHGVEVRSAQTATDCMQQDH